MSIDRSSPITPEERPKPAYEHFIQFARSHGCKEVKAITTPANTQSILFHKAIGMQLAEGSSEKGIPVVKDYGGPGKDAVLFCRQIL
jgi:hypothetical protein